MPKWLRRTYGVQLFFETQFSQVSVPWVTAADGRRFHVDRVIVAAGADFRALYPDLYERAGFQLCKLQMMRTRPQPNGWRIGPMLAGGLTLRHYAAFAQCPSWPALEERVARETPELNQVGIHVMASQNGMGEVILGDSHEHNSSVDPFDSTIFDDLILRELRRMIDVPDWTIAEHWHGVYPKTPKKLQYVAEPEPEVSIAIASGGCGMTLSFGLADQMWTSEYGNCIAGV